MPETIDERIERRKYLKYVGAAAIGVAIGYLGGLKYPVEPSAKTFTQTVTETQFETVTERITETVKLASLTGRLFFDYNGDGIQDKNEPAVSKARVYLTDNSGKLIAEAFTDSSGDYKLEDVPSGIYRLNIEADKKFRYMCRSVEEFRAVNEGYDVLLNESKRINIGLTEGVLTLPFPKSVQINVADYFDHDPGIDRMWWNGKRLSGSGGHTPPWTHPEIDYLMPKGTEVKAAINGKIVGINTSHGEVYWISLFNERYNYGTSYLHIEKPLVPIGSYVKRGDSIALSGDTGSLGRPHLAFQLWKHMPDGKNYCIDLILP